MIDLQFDTNQTFPNATVSPLFNAIRVCASAPAVPDEIAIPKPRIARHAFVQMRIDFLLKSETRVRVMARRADNPHGKSETL
jgi:hypothetical protein